MNIPLGNYVSVSDVQRDYRKVFDKAKKTKEPVMVLCDNKPDVVISDSKTWDEIKNKIQEIELNQALEAIRIAKKEEKMGTLKELPIGGLSKLAQE